MTCRIHVLSRNLELYQLNVMMALKIISIDYWELFLNSCWHQKIPISLQKLFKALLWRHESLLSELVVIQLIRIKLFLPSSALLSSILPHLEVVDNKSVLKWISREPKIIHLKKRTFNLYPCRCWLEFNLKFVIKRSAWDIGINKFTRMPL